MPSAFELENVDFVAPILLSEQALADGAETQTTLSSYPGSEGKHFKFRIIFIHAHVSTEEYDQVDQECEAALDQMEFCEAVKEGISIDYGPSFQRLDHIRFDAQGKAVAKLLPYGTDTEVLTIHPVVLDEVFQLGFAALSGGGVASQIPTMVPRRLGKLWISNEGRSDAITSGDNVHALARTMSARRATVDAFVLNQDITLEIEDLELFVVSGPEVARTTQDAEDACFHMEGKTHIDLLAPDDLDRFLEEARDVIINEPVEWARDMDFVMLSFAANTFEKIRSTKATIIPEMEQYALWLQSHLDDFANSDPCTASSLHNRTHLDSLLDKMLPSAIVLPYIQVGENLIGLLTGSVDPLALLFEDESLMANFYTDLISRSTALEPFRRYLDCLVHKQPKLRFLEVGAWTGSTTVEILSVIDKIESAPCFESYDFTDVSPAFFEKAKTKLGHHDNRISYRVFNIEEDPLTQGFAESHYDVIIADNVLHATRNIDASLHNLKMLLKPKGQLILKEMITPRKLLRLVESRREIQDCAKKPRYLSETVEWVTSPCWCHTWSFVILTRVHDQRNGHHDKAPPIIIYDPSSDLQRQTARGICNRFGLSEAYAIPYKSEQVHTPTRSDTQSCIVLMGMNEERWWNLNGDFLTDLKTLVSSSSSLVWVTGGGGYSMQSPNTDDEPEYRQVENRLEINRLKSARKLDSYISSRFDHLVGLHKMEEKKLRLGVRVPGPLDTLEWTEGDWLSEPLDLDEVVIAVKTLGVNFKDCLKPLGQVDSDSSASECAALVVRVGSNCGDALKPGDRVAACALDAYKTFVLTRKHMVVKLPDRISFTEGASLPVVSCTAMYSLAHVARLQKGESILIHAAAGGTGQATVQIARRMGADIFATVGSSSKKALLIERYGLAEDGIFYSRDGSFADGIKRVTDLMSSEATYVVAGGLGGIGRRISSSLVDRGAKHLVLPSRSGLEGNEAGSKLVQGLTEKGVDVVCPQCNICDATSLQQALDQCSTMPPICGCFQATMSLRDATFAQLSIEDWLQCTRPKLQGSWNLHCLLPTGMDFFILLSSMTGIIRNAGQSSYAAGNTFLDALARHRTSRGERTAALDLGAIRGDGYLAENEEIMTRLLRLTLLKSIPLQTLLVMLEYYCDPSQPYSASK
ncbi:KR-domain-containing protein [Massarina eburnea CBS 473.64]|uniref:KR-domain-containing protein n=1 Tax=Massarina eburnea CBS 473.64 TaxID=1395130 RepID=A0A6A6RR95_9PLEO|nr:KR-domain-containing protein [Massarina eburnea CBS 473.64]